MEEGCMMFDPLAMKSISSGVFLSLTIPNSLTQRSTPQHRHMWGELWGDVNDP